jgi:hypothetical protein
MDLAKEERAASIEELASAPLEDAIQQVTEVVIECKTSAPFDDRAKTEAIPRLSFNCPIRIL